MQFRLPCECGEYISVTEGAAGVAVPCACGRKVPVPALAELQRRAESGEIASSLYAEGDGPPPPPSPAAQGVRAVLQGVIFVVGGVVLVLGVGLFIGNVTGIFPTVPLAGYVTMAAGIGMLGFAARARASEED